MDVIIYGFNFICLTQWDKKEKEMLAPLDSQLVMPIVERFLEMSSFVVYLMFIGSKITLLIV